MRDKKLGTTTTSSASASAAVAATTALLLFAIGGNVQAFAPPAATTRTTTTTTAATSALLLSTTSSTSSRRTTTATTRTILSASTTSSSGSSSTLQVPPTPKSVVNGKTAEEKKNNNKVPAAEEQEEAMAWECDEDMNCVQVPACDDEGCRTTLDVRIHGNWYDLSGWRKAHPAGTHWIDWYDGRDATEVMDAFHSRKARDMWQRLPRSSPAAIDMLSANVAEDSSTQIAFRQLRDQLEAEGWWERDWWVEGKLLAIWASLVVGAAATAHSLPPVSTVLLGLAMTNAGWLGHDYVHGVDTFCDTMRNFAAIAAGLGPTWWSDKHNKHHALTNEMGVDEDIATDPFIFTWAPDPANDSPLRKIQHYIFWIPFSFLFALWRVDTLKVAIDAIEEKRPKGKEELYCLLAHYLVLLTVFPVAVWLPAVFLSGLISALIVTPTHQSEELFRDYQPDWVTAQFESTRNAVLTNPFSTWLWGGMQYQLEHHLFPSMPRSKYPLLKPILQQFAAENGVPGGYRESGEWEILVDNWRLYKNVAEADPVPGAPNSRGDGQLGAIAAGTSPASTGFVATPAAAVLPNLKK